MKIAVFHNFMDNIGGAEIVGLTLARELNADFYTTNIDKEKIKKMGFSDVLSRIKSIGKVPLNAPFRQQIALWRFRRLNLGKKYDFYIISGDWAMSGAVNNKLNLWYAHSPLNELWEFKDYIKHNLLPWWQRPLFEIWVRINRFLNKKYLKHVDVLVCNSENTKRRIARYYDRKAEVINPPISCREYFYKKNGDFWLSVNRLFKNKRVDIQLKAFSKIPNENLVIVGSYEKSKNFMAYAKYCGEICPKNAVIKSWVSKKELIDLYSNCKGFITTSRDEDFGMNVVEAMASGKPVIAPNEGGYKETVIDGKTGKLIDNIDAEKVIEAIKEIGKNPKKYKSACLKQAKIFDEEVFIRKIKNKLSEI